MSEPAEEGELDFEHAQFEQPEAGAMQCAVCEQPFAERYYVANGHPMCEACLTNIEPGAGSLLRGLAYGVGAGAVGAVIYYGIRVLTGYDLALLTLALGVAVGLAVRKGAADRSGKLSRVMAVAIAYAAMSSVYIPMLAETLVADAAGDTGAGAAGEPALDDAGAPGEEVPVVLAYAVAGLLSLTIPVLLVTEMEVLALIIFAVGLWEAWRLSEQPRVAVEGPFEVDVAAAPAPAGEAEPSTT